MFTDFTLDMDDWSRYSLGTERKFENKCLPQYCLKDMFHMHGGGGMPTTPSEKAKGNPVKLTGAYIDPKSGLSYWEKCDANPYCQSWHDFKSSFYRKSRFGPNRYGQQGVNEKASRMITLDGKKWYFGFVISSKNEKGNTLNGNWIPAVSGGQASFSASMHW